VIREEEDGNDIPLRPGFYVDILRLCRSVTENASGPPVHGAPDHGGGVGIRSARWIDAQLPSESVWGVGRGPEHGGSIACTGRHPHLSVNARLEDAAIAPHHQRGSAPVSIRMLLEGKIAGKDKFRPPVGNLPGRIATERVETAHITRHHAGRIAGVGLCAGCAAPQEKRGNGDEEQYPEIRMKLSETHDREVYPPLPQSSKMGYD